MEGQRSQPREFPNGSRVQKWLKENENSTDVSSKDPSGKGTINSSQHPSSSSASLVSEISLQGHSLSVTPVPEDPLTKLAQRIREISSEQGNFRSQPNHPSVNPAYMQIAARQVTGKDLPVFSGNPEDWPMFIRIFEETTNACGFSNVENQVRLQKCLRGDALETVRSRLLMPEGVPHVIKTLEMRFGRPELIIRSMLERIHRLPSPKPDRLETLIDFGLAVHNLVVHLQAAKQESHLNNPTLLQELVAKLPVQLKLDWAKYKLLNSTPTLATFGCFMEQLIQAASDVPLNQNAKFERPRNKEKNAAHSYSHENKFDRHSLSHSKRNELTKKHDKICQFCKESAQRVSGCK
ncbi:uncharacterized protein LOC129728719 [Wyeomyia smithii]|uniref:uncharacterized protein LOC129728719 n=1 Tax=Wyeomyia smithii TaxID=174621 RepID=UPI0024680AD4|nr:uncharacterized protein LOC129728719 [Wyeomyia smithii]